MFKQSRPLFPLILTLGVLSTIKGNSFGSDSFTVQEFARKTITLGINHPEVDEIFRKMHAAINHNAIDEILRKLAVGVFDGRPNFTAQELNYLIGLSQYAFDINGRFCLTEFPPYMKEIIKTYDLTYPKTK